MSQYSSSAVKSCNKKFECKLAADIKGNSKSFFSDTYVRRPNQRKELVPWKI